MTSSTERSPGSAQRPCGPQWRQAAAGAQERALPDGRVTVSCSAAPGNGGLGRHLQELADALARRGALAAVISGAQRDSEPGGRGRLGRLLAAAPVPVSPGLRTRVFMTEFDAYAAARLPAGEHLIAFNGQALGQFAAARRAGYGGRDLVSANSHMRRLARQHALARSRYPLEGSWARHMVARNLAEYAQADRIYVSSAYVRDSFLEQGFAGERLVEFPLTPDPRFTPRPEPSGGRFEIVYVGSLVVHKGVPLLIDAVRRLGHRDLRLTLVGGWASRGMRRFVQRALAADERIRVRPGDPLEHLRAARLYVHPAYEDGFGYAPAEALACGVPVLVSQDTGMKGLIDTPRAGAVLPTGDLDALSEAIDAAYRGEILDG